MEATAARVYRQYPDSRDMEVPASPSINRIYHNTQKSQYNTRVEPHLIILTGAVVQACVLLHRAAGSVAMPMIPQTYNTEVYVVDTFILNPCMCLFDFLLPASSSAHDCCYAKENYNMTAMVNSFNETISAGERA